MSDAEEVLKFGIYRQYTFNDTDKHLREAGFYCEELVEAEDFALVLRRLAKTTNDKLAILPAGEVITSKEMPNRYALYMPIRGRILAEEQPLQSRKPIGDTSEDWGPGGRSPFLKDGPMHPHPHKKY